MKKQHLTVVEWDIVSFLARGSVVKRTKDLLWMQEDLDTIQQIFLLGIRWSEMEPEEPDDFVSLQDEKAGKNDYE